MMAASSTAASGFFVAKSGGLVYNLANSRNRVQTHCNQPA
jgi:hypothetical protein